MELRTFIAALACGLVVGCGGGGGGGGSGGLPAPTGLAVDYDVKAYAFSWNAVGGATHYQVSEDPDGPGPEGASVVGGQITGTTFKLTHGTLLHRKLNAQYSVRACNINGCSAPSAEVQPDVARAIGYFKSSNPSSIHSQLFGAAVALSEDGGTLAVGAYFEDGAATGINGNDQDIGEFDSGAVYVFVRSGEHWVQEAYIKQHNTEAGDDFGISIALSSDGNTLAVGAQSEDGTSNGAEDSGAVYVFARSAGTWMQQDYLKASNTGASDRFGSTVALSGDGNTLAVGAPHEDSATRGNPSNEEASSAGAVYVFTRSGNTWSQQDYVKPTNPGIGDQFGAKVAISIDGKTLAVGAPEQSGIEARSGAVYVFAQNGATKLWTEQKLLKASNADEQDAFGISVALSADGNTLAVGAMGEDGGSTGVGGDKNDNSKLAAGAAYVFARTGSTWGDPVYIKASNTAEGAHFGSAVALSSDGNSLAVGARNEFGGSTGIGGNQADMSKPGAGAVYVFARSASAWSQQAYLKASNADEADWFGVALALSGNGGTLAVGARYEKSVSKGINGDQSDNSGTLTGAVYLY